MHGPGRYEFPFCPDRRASPEIRSPRRRGHGPREHHVFAE